MSLTTSAFVAWLVISALAAGVFFVIYWRSTTKPVSIAYEIVNRRRFKIFFALVAGFLILFLVAMMNVPYTTAGEVDQIVGAKARMFSFELSTDTVECGKLVEFRVVAEDVTHGFGIYGQDGNLIGQVQAMPGYVNRLRVRFVTPGRYNILCLEYCGPLHHQMKSSIVVR